MAFLSTSCDNNKEGVVPQAEQTISTESLGVLSKAPDYTSGVTEDQILYFMNQLESGNHVVMIGKKVDGDIQIYGKVINEPASNPEPEIVNDIE